MQINSIFQRMRGFGILAAALVGFSAGEGALAQDAERGERVFNKCKACHQVGEGAASRTGPQLNGIVGAQAGAVEDFRYSKAFIDSGIIWDANNLSSFLANPRDFLPGTRMSFAGLRKEEEIDNVIAYLETFAADGSVAE